MKIEQRLRNEARPDDVPKGWIVCEAARPLWGHREYDVVWHRVAIDPTHPDAPAMLQFNAEQKAWTNKYVSDEDLAPIVAQERADNQDTFEKFPVTDEQILADVKDRLYQFGGEVDIEELLSP